MTQIRKTGISRRTLLLGTGAAALAMPAIWSPARSQNKRIVVRDDGGIYNRAYNAVFYRPFAEATGIQVVGAQANAEPTAQIKSMVDTGSYTWDMAKISWPATLILTEGGNRRACAELPASSTSARFLYA
jgi:putative spermidine/putrescine transport system substrate-binding protein